MARKSTLLLPLIVAFTTASAALASQQEEPGPDYTRAIAVRHLGRGYLGVQLTRLTPELRAHFGVPEDVGVMVARVEEGGPAETAGVRVGDIVTAIDGERVDDGRTLSRVAGAKEAGETVTLELYRSGGLESYPVIVAARERPVIDLSGGYRFFPEGGEPGHNVFFAGSGLHLDEESVEAFEEAIRELEDNFDSIEWQEKLERMKEMDFDAIQTRMKEVEQRLQQLEKELEKETSKK